jgi:hypothetical protein
MKLTSLEIERNRRATERKATLDRINMIDERLREIISEQEEIREILEKTEKQSDERASQSSGERLKFEY